MPKNGFFDLFFLKAPSAPIYTNFEGERAPKKCVFLVKIFQKVPKNGFFDLFFQIACGAESLAKTGSFYCFGRARNVNLIDPKKKKKVVKIFENFLKIRPPPLEKILDPPLRTSFQNKLFRYNIFTDCIFLARTISNRLKDLSL